jgi:hypothetical protein
MKPRHPKFVAGFPVLAILLTGAAIQCGCQAYQFGAPTMHRFEIRTVHVPIIESDSFRRFLGVRLTEAVVKEIELNTPFTIASADRADSFLVARIRHDSKRTQAESINDHPRVIETDLRVEVSWSDRGGQPLMQRQMLKISREVDFIPEAGQSITTAQQALIDRIARQIVNQMEMPW